MRALLEAVGRGERTPDEALEALAALPFRDGADVRVDTHRALRQGHPEVIFAPGKTAAQIAEVMRLLREAGQPGLATRVPPETAAAVRRELPEADYDPVGRLLWLGPDPVPLQGKGTIAVIAAGTSDLPVAAEAAGTARRFGNQVELLVDVRVLVVVAGMEGALPSVVGGMVDKPVIAVPTSVGYGASFGGLAALLGMLNSCASNVTVVNVDNGFGAATVASLINRL
jgi:NCAIR mutase (PurE)-related protein